MGGGGGGGGGGGLCNGSVCGLYGRNAGLSKVGQGGSQSKQPPLKRWCEGEGEAAVGEGGEDGGEDEGEGGRGRR